MTSENWYVLDCKNTSTGEDFVATGVLMYSPTFGCDYLVQGNFVTSNYGPQFKLDFMTPIVPDTKKAIVRYLSSEIRGIGEKAAEAIYAKFGDDAVTLLEQDPERIKEVKRLGKKQKQSAKDWFSSHSILSEQKRSQAIYMLNSYGLPFPMAQRVVKQYGDNALEVVNKNPYQLIDDFTGIGFLTADKIAQNLGISHESYARIRAGVMYYINRACESEGHCYLDTETIHSSAARLLNVPEENVVMSMDEMRKKLDIVQPNKDETYINWLYYCESGVARELARLKETSRGGETD